MDRQRAAEVLGVHADDDIDTIMAAYRRATLNTHPDLGGDSEAFVEATAAKEELTKPVEAATEVVPTFEPAPGESVVSKPVARVMWMAIASGSATAVAVVILVIILAPAAPTAGPIVIVAIGYAAAKAWRAAGQPRPTFGTIRIGKQRSEVKPVKTKARTNGRSTADEDWTRPPREWT